MAKQNISSTELNGEEIKSQIAWIKAKLEKAENSGFTKDSKEQILVQAKINHL